MTTRRSNAMAARAKAGGTTSSSEVEDTFLSLHQHEGVLGVVATTADGAVIKSTLKDAQETTRYALLAAGVCREAHSSTGKLPSFLKMKAGDREILITPSKKYTLIAVTKISNPSADATQ
ncbi:dynein light chain roadblock-type 1-like [Dermacentor andersoni]|uniref:dynein light chain roadblock-type 1-like n=1 Tax=Dermacentor andersoni TaxID=34620 RepID=UPI002155619E|nr:dynein light chain roadblock-type 1-like [Dermacentor andersoni]